MAEKKTPTTRARAKKAETSKAEDVKDIVSEGAEDGSQAVEQADDVAPAEGSTDQTDAPKIDESADTSDSALVLEDPHIPDAEPVSKPVTPQTMEERKGGFFPMLLGGVIAGGLGFGAAYYSLNTANDTSALESKIGDQISAQSDEIAALSSSLDAVPPPVDISGIEAAQGDMLAAVDSLATRLDAIEAQFGALDARLSDVEKRPLTEGASDAAVAAYERELKALQDAMAAQRAEIEAMASEAQTMEASAEETAQATMRRAALTRIQTALDTGTGFAPALADLETAGVPAPDVLVAVSDEGVPSLAQLQADFPEAARAALAVSRRDAAAEGGGGSGFSAFLKNQLGARSLEPREGDEPDAVLSRAEAAAGDGRLTDALAEIEALPEGGRAEMADWSAQVTGRLDAVAAAETLGNELN